MVALFGQDLDRVELRRRLADLRAACGVRLSTLTDGPERGVRILEFRTGTGLRFTVAVDRGMDVGELEWRGMPFGWHSASGYRAPALHDPEAEGGSGLLRSFTGFMLTCGFDHARRPEKEAPGHFRADTVPELMQPLHGRGALAPARLVGYGADWRDDASLVLWCEGEVRQAVLYGEHFVLRRRIEAVAGTSRFTVADRLVNEACVPVPHMLLYHLNLGWPLLDAGSRFLAPVSETVWSGVSAEAQRLGFWTQQGPQPAGAQQVAVHRVVADADGFVRTALVNDRIGTGVAVSWPKRQLPWLQHWQCLSEGTYALGVEPVTNRFGSRAELAQTGELEVLQPGETRVYDLAVEVLDGPAALEGCETAIRACAPLLSETPPRTGRMTP
jgi:hypothetical protein